MKGTYTYSRKRKPKNKRGTTDVSILDYTHNNLNQYTSIATVPPVPPVTFVPQSDACGNQTKILTSTGIWQVLYNAKNRPIKFTQGSTIIECKFNFMGARTETKITTNGVTTKHERFINRGYLLIACLDLTRATQNDLYLILWDPTQPIATRPLAIQKGGTWYSYGHDITKNITETFNSAGQIASIYLYSPFGAVTSTGTFTQPLQWSSEFFDSELGLTYYHFRHYNPKDGRWISRDLIGERGGWNLYAFLMNGVGADRLGTAPIVVKFDAPQLKDVPVEWAPPDKKSYALNDHKFACLCECRAVGEDPIMTCTMEYTPKIFISQQEVTARGVTTHGVIGHEQRHIIDRISRIKKIIKPLERHNILMNKEGCDKKAKDITVEYTGFLEADFSIGKHEGDRGATPQAPKNATEYPPLFIPPNFSNQ